MRNLLCFSVLVATISASGDVAPSTPSVERITTGAGPQWHNLDGKMVTLSQSNGGISFASPGYPWLSTPSPSYTTIQYSTPGHTIKGLSVCLRYTIDYRQPRYGPTYLFTFGPSRTLRLRFVGNNQYILLLNGYSLYLNTDLFLWPNTEQTLWTKICLKIDSGKNVVQMFSGRQASIRKILPFSFVWSGQPVIEFSGFDGQVTDVQVWDYPLSNKEILRYMNPYMLGPLVGSVLKWSHISYSVRGIVLLEDTYENQVKKPDMGK
eukprot:XP_011611923.1 PREDICTED: C-reactive protein-like [Takifugu rubripes]